MTRKVEIPDKSNDKDENLKLNPNPEFQLNPDQIRELSHEKIMELQESITEKLYKRLETHNKRLSEIAAYFEEQAYSGIYQDDDYIKHNWIEKIEMQTDEYIKLAKVIDPPTARLLDIYDGIDLNLNRAGEYIEGAERAGFDMPESKKLIEKIKFDLISVLDEGMH